MLKHKDLIDFTLNPFELFANWYDLAIETEINDPNAMTLSTISNNRPSSRVVLLKSHDEKGFVFYTNSNSKKGKSISENNNIALNFHWKTQNRQIRIEGTANIVNNKMADSYFKSRPRGSQLGAIVSNQSAVIDSKKELEENLINLESKYRNKSIPKPINWGGYIVSPVEYEFWQGGENRLHDRARFSYKKNHWIIDRLSP